MGLYEYPFPRREKRERLEKHSLLWPFREQYEDIQRFMDDNQAVLSALQVRDCWETLIKFFTSLAIADYIYSGKKSEKCNENIFSILLKDKGISMGDWVRMLDILLKDYPAYQTVLSERLRSLFYKKARNEWYHLRLRELWEGKDGFVYWRNTRFAHGVLGKDLNEYGKDAEKWLKNLEEAFDLCRPIFQDLSICSELPNQNEPIWNESPLHFYHEHVGNNHLFHVKAKITGQEIPLSPLVTIQRCDLCEKWSVFFLQRYKKQKAYFLDFLWKGEINERENEEILHQWSIYATNKPEQEEQEINIGEEDMFFEYDNAEPLKYVFDKIAKFVRSHPQRGVIDIVGRGGIGKSWCMRGLERGLQKLMERPIPCIRIIFHREDWNVLKFKSKMEDAASDKKWRIPDNIGISNKDTLSLWLQELMKINDIGELVVILDGLDELPPDSDIPSLLPQLENLPKGCFLVWTRRPEKITESIAQMLEKVFASSENRLRLTIEPQDKEYRQILLKYARKRLSQRRSDGKALPMEWAGQLVEKAEGIFLYVFHYCHKLHFGQYPDLSSLPKPQEFYPYFFEHLRKRVGESLFESCYAKLLSLIHIAQKPVGVSFLERFQIDRQKANMALQEFADMLESFRSDSQETLYSIRHSILKEFLNLAPEWKKRCEEVEKDLLERLKKKSEKGNWFNIDRENGLDSYALGCYAQHLIRLIPGQPESLPKLQEILQKHSYLDKKCECFGPQALQNDLQQALRILRGLPAEKQEEHSSLEKFLALLEKAIRLDQAFLTAHPDVLFQCLWNRCWWYDAPQAREYYETPEEGWDNVPRFGEKGIQLYKFMEEWRKEKEERTPGFVWLENMRPPDVDLERPVILQFHCNFFGTPPELIFSPNHQYLAVFYQTEVKVVEVETGKIIFSKEKLGEVMALQFSPDNQCIVAGCKDGWLKKWDLASGEIMNLLEIRSEQKVLPLTNISFYPQNHNQIVTGGEDGVVRIWDIAEKRKFSEISLPIQGKQKNPDTEQIEEFWEYLPLLARFSKNGEQIIAMAARGIAPGEVALEDQPFERAIVVDAKRPEIISHIAFKVPFGINDPNFIANDSWVIGSQWGGVWLWELNSGKVRELIPHYQGGSGPTHLAVSPDEKTAVVSFIVNNQPYAFLLDIATGQKLLDFERGPEYIRNLSFSADGKWLTGAHNGSAWVWDVQTGKKLCEFKAQGYVIRAVFTPAGKRLVICTDKGLTLWDLLDLFHESSLLNLKEQGYCCGYLSSGDAQAFITIESSNTEPQQPVADISSFAVPPLQELLAKDREYRIWRTWNLETGLTEKCVIGKYNSQQSKLSPNGKLLAIAQVNHLYVLEIPSLEKRHTLDHLYFNILQIEFSPDSRYVGTYSGNKEGEFLKIWDVNTGTPVYTFSLPHIAVNPTSSVIFWAQDSTEVGIMGELGHYFVWDLRTGKEIYEGKNDDYPVGWAILQAYGILFAAGVEIGFISFADTAKKTDYLQYEELAPTPFLYHGLPTLYLSKEMNKFSLVYKSGLEIQIEIQKNFRLQPSTKNLTVKRKFPQAKAGEFLDILLCEGKDADFHFPIPFQTVRFLPTGDRLIGIQGAYLALLRIHDKK